MTTIAGLQVDISGQLEFEKKLNLFRKKIDTIISFYIDYAEGYKYNQICKITEKPYCPMLKFFTDKLPAKH